MVFRSPIYYPVLAAPPPAGDDLGIDLTDAVFCFSTYQATAAAGVVNPFRLASGADVVFVDGVADETTDQNAFINLWRNQVSGQPDVDTSGSASENSSQQYRRGIAPFPAGVNGVFADFRAGLISTSNFNFNATGWTFMSVVVTGGTNANNTLAVLGDDNNTANAVQLLLNNNRLAINTQPNGTLTFNGSFNSLQVLTIVCPVGATASDVIVLQNNTQLTGSGTTNGPSIDQNTGMVLHNRNQQNVNGRLAGGGTVFNAFWNNGSSSQYLANISALRTAFNI